MGPVPKRSLRRVATAAWAGTFAAAALVACAGQDPEAASLASAKERTVSMMNELDYESVLTLTGTATDDGGTAKSKLPQRMTDIETVEAYVFCDSPEAHLGLTVNGEELDVTCSDVEEPEVIALAAENFEAGRDVSVRADSSALPAGDTFGVLIRVVTS